MGLIESFCGEGGFFAGVGIDAGDSKKVGAIRRFNWDAEIGNIGPEKPASKQVGAFINIVRIRAGIVIPGKRQSGVRNSGVQMADGERE